MMKPNAQALLLCVAALQLATAQQLVFTSYYVTQCVDADHPPQNTMTGLVVGVPDEGTGSTSGHVSYSMPECVSCGCNSCTATSTFVTSFPAFCPGQKSSIGGNEPGFTEQTYTVTETYVGVSNLPQFAAATEVPFGFTISVATCTACSQTANQGGNGAVVVETMTYPQDNTPFAMDLACAQECDDDSTTSTQNAAGTTSAPAYVTGGNGSNGSSPVIMTVSGSARNYGEAHWVVAMLGIAAMFAALF